MVAILNQTRKEVSLSIQGSDVIIYINIALCAINGAFSLIALLGNFVALGAIWRTPSLHIPSNVFVFGLAVSDFGVGLIVQPTFVVFLLIEFTSKTNSINAWTAFRSTQAVFVSATILTLTLISADRVAALSFHLRYQAIVTIRRACCILSLVWIACIAYGITLPIALSLHGKLSNILFTSCLVINSLAYLIIYRITRRHQVQIRAQEQIQIQQDNGAWNLSRYRKTAINMFLLFILFVLCYVPYTFVRVYIKFADWTRVHIALALRLSASMVYLNSSLNPLLYCWRMRDLRMAMKSFLRALC